MTTKNIKLMEAARLALKNKWGLAIGTFFIYMVIMSISSYAAFIIAGSLMLGTAQFSLNISRNQEAKLEDIFSGFKNFTNGLIAYLLIFLRVFLWSLLFVIPGIIAAISYSMTYYIMIDEPELSPKAAMEKSRVMMDGYKWKYFYLGLRFLGWALLCLLTLGIGFLWLIPYMNITNAKFYEDLKNSATPKVNGI